MTFTFMVHKTPLIMIVMMMAMANVFVDFAVIIFVMFILTFTTKVLVKPVVDVMEMFVFIIMLLVQTMPTIISIFTTITLMFHMRTFIFMVVIAASTFMVLFI
ncbi:hypothetical protein [Ureibacillus acetophenoni]|uniref:hypothetical protein n=1 Tax=Ureibacillus acetophenoni TaxID=614649 RepID=UPI001142F774|nr:hypothetical protein [Ureibacillus acetophenoni]